jgi:hypothetical protein
MIFHNWNPDIRCILKPRASGRHLGEPCVTGERGVT